MIWLTIIVAGLISVAALFYVLAPLLRPGPATRLVDDDRLADLIGRKDSVVRAIKELEFDYHVGKLNEEDYQRLNARLRRQAIGLLQQIEKLAPATASLDEQLEARITALRKTQDRPIPPEDRPVADGRIAESGVCGRMTAEHEAPEPAALATVKAAASGERQPRFCTHCGQPVEETHKFCANCGTPVAEVAGTSR